MRVSVFGLGYVGAVSAACYAANGHDVVGVDSAASKVDLINAGRAPIREKDLDELIAKAVRRDVLRATRDAKEAVHESDLSLICVGTPSQPNGSLDLHQVEAVSREIGAALRTKHGFHTIVNRSTVLPGSVRDVVIPAIEAASGKKAGKDFGVGHNPEFMRESTAVHDFFKPAKIVVGAADEETGRQIASLYRGIQAPLFMTSIEVAEMVKCTDNVWHALKVAFANEVGAVCKPLGIDSHAVMELFCQDTKLNLSPEYLKPGFSFGGSCLPKDVRAITYQGRAFQLNLPILGAILPSNDEQTSRGFEMIAALGKRRVTFLGMSFKAGTDDLRESPLVELIVRLLELDYDVRVFDRFVRLPQLLGANLEYLLRMLPHAAGLLVETLDEALAHGEVVVIGNKAPEFSDVISRLRPDQLVIDLVRVPGRGALNGRYHGVNW